MRLSASTWALLCLAWGQVETVLGALQDAPSTENYLRRSGAVAVAIGDYVYIDGGEVAQNDDGEPPAINQPSNRVNSTLSIDMSRSWSASTVKITSITKSAPKLMGQAIWEDTTSSTPGFYIWGGHTPYGSERNDIQKRSVWRFEADGQGGGSWTKKLSSNQEMQQSFVLPECGAFTTAGNTGVFVGGTGSSWTDPNIGGGTVLVPGVVSFDMDTLTWRNDTAPDELSPDGTLRDGTAAYAPTFGPNGLVFVLGGVTYSLGTTTNTPDGTIDFSPVPFFDPVTRTWYRQPATGQVPRSRKSFCSVGVQSPNGTYEIFIFGGIDTVNNKMFDDVYVLSIPGFVWTKMPGNTGDGGARLGHTCVRVGKRQMLSIGGSASGAGMKEPASFYEGWTNPDNWPQGLGILDMTELSWSTDYKADAAEYESPKVIKDWYASGNQSDVKWASDDIRKLFITEEGSGGGSDDADSQTPPTTPSTSSSTPVGAIAGGVVGGVVALAAIAAALWYFLRRRKQTNPEKAVPSPSYEPATENKGWVSNQSGLAEAEGRPVYNPHELGVHANAVELPNSTNMPPVELYGGPVKR